MITKDSDFADNLLLHQNLYKLVLVCTGNIPNDALMGLFQRNWETLLQILPQYTFIELGSEAILVRW